MKILVLGLGSMGKRRIRCLKALGYHDIIGIDTRTDRVKEAIQNGIEAFEDVSQFSTVGIDAIFVCTPPDKHELGLNLALEYRVPAFVEASVVLDQLDEINQLAKERNVFIAPSCTMFYHPAIKLIHKFIADKQYGKVTNFSYHCGQYLPDWHPWENVQDYYVSNPITGGCREIVPFELTWMTKLLGWPLNTAALFGKTMNVGADIHDTYSVSLQFPECYGAMVIDVTSRYAVRRLTLNLERAQILWSWDKPSLHFYDVNTDSWSEISYVFSEHGMDEYNKNICEAMYIDEVSDFLDAIHEKKEFPNNLDSDIKVLTLLSQIERNNQKESLDELI